MNSAREQCVVAACFMAIILVGAHRPAGADEVADFHLEVSKGDADKVEQYLSKEPTLVNHRSSNKFTPLFQAAIQGHTAIVKLLLEHGATVDARVLGETPLFRACMNGSTETAGVLLNKGASLSSTNDDGETPLYVAIRRLHVSTVRLLLDRGADPNMQRHDLARAERLNDERIYIPLHEAMAGVQRTMRWRAKYEKEGDEAQVARYGRHLRSAEEIARMLISHKRIDVAAQHPRGGGAALHFAASCGHIQLAKLLLDRGADVNSRSDRLVNGPRRLPPYNQTPLHIAVARGQNEMAEFLLENGADRNAKDSRGATPFDLKQDNRD